MKHITKLFDWCRECKYSNLIIALSFTIILFLECGLFYYLAFRSILISSLWKNTYVFCVFYSTKLSISVFFGALVLLFRKKIWSVIALVLFNIHMFAELIYYRANGIFLDTFSITMIGNMDGFWGSVPMYINASDFLLVALSILYIIIYILFNNKSRNWIVCICGLIISFGLNVYGCFECERLYVGYNINYYINPFGEDEVHSICGFTTTEYQKSMSVIHALIYNVLDLCRYYLHQDNYTMTNQDEIDIQAFIGDSGLWTPKTRLQIFVIESLEGWVITPEITPNIWKLVKKDSSVLFAPYVKSEKRGGTSADGQMIINTGLLPLQKGAACYRYPGNVYPSLSDLYDNTADIIPGNMSVWNQKRMSDAYQIKKNYVTSTDDKDILSLYDSIKTFHDYNMVITMSTHSPFHDYSNKTSLILPDDMPKFMHDYIMSINYMDEHLGMIINQIDNCEYLSNSTIIIAGDHSIFSDGMRQEFVEYCQKSGAKYEVGLDYTALVLYSPLISKSVKIENQCYQMDIFPTVLNLIGCKNYYWNGFGVNLLDSVSNGGRKITENESFILSDKVIRSNYFEKYLNRDATAQ